MPTECFRVFFNLFSGLFCRGSLTGPATLAFMLLGRFCAGKLNFSRLKFPPRRWALGPHAANVAFHTIIVHRCSIQHSKNGVRINCHRRKMQFVWPVFLIVSCVFLPRVINLKRKVGSGPAWVLCGGNWTSHSSPKCHTKTRKAPNFSLTASPGTNYTCETHSRFFFGWKETKCFPFK